MQETQINKLILNMKGLHFFQVIVKEYIFFFTVFLIVYLFKILKAIAKTPDTSDAGKHNLTCY